MIQFQPTRKDVDGDLTLVVFPFVKLLRCKPEDAGHKIGAFLKENIEEIQSFAVLKGFLNIILSDQYWLGQLEKSSMSNFGFSAPKSKPLVMVELN